MPKVIQSTAALSLAGTLLAAVLFLRLRNGIYLTLAITLGTTAYHLGMRLLVGAAFHAKMKNRADYRKRWYQPHPWEERLYQILQVRAWKDRLPTYDPAAFSIKYHTWDEIAQAMCQSELVHETSAVLSFLPLVFSVWFGAFFTFFITSLCGAVVDLLFVVIQRYNRPRVVKIALRRRRITKQDLPADRP